MIRFYAVFFVVMLGAQQYLYAQTPMTLHDPKLDYPLNESVLVLEDPAGEWGIDDVLHPSINSRFIDDSGKLSYGFTSITYWFKFKLRNEAHYLHEWVLEIPYPLLDKLEVFQMNEDGVWDKTLLGDYVPFYNREIIYRNFVVPLNFMDHREHTFYVRVSTSSSMRVPLIARSLPRFQEESLESEIIYGIYYGIMLVMLVYNLLVFFTLNDISYLFYVVSIFFTLTLFSALSGHAFQYLWFDSIWWANHIIALSMGGLAIGTALFASTFLEVKKYSHTWHYILNFIIGSGVVIIIATIFLGYATAVIMGTLVLALDAIALLSTGVVCLAKGNKAARYYIMAWTGYLLGAVLIILVSYGVLPSYPIFAHAVEAGSAIEVTLLAIALSDKYSLIRKEKEALQAEALESQRRTNITLEEKVSERTHEINVKREEIERKNKRLENQNDEINHQKEKIESSIRYAQRIQTAMLPSELEVRKFMPESFIFFKPRDIVSGDFYWLSEREGKLILAVADCTGHGVPGAFMSMLGSNLLNEIVNERNITSPELILQELNEGVRKSLSQDYSQNQDGMEISICAIDRKARQIAFAGANSPLLYIHEHQLELIKGDRMPIGGHRKRYIGKQFHKKIINVEPSTAIYMFSDGFRDQFGGSNGDKFMMKRFQRLLQDINQEPMEAQEIMITRTFREWVGDNRQIDDVLVVGLRIE